MRIEVALFGSRETAFTERAMRDLAERERRWDDRERVTVEAADEETLASVLRRAGEQFGVRGPGHDTVAPVPNFLSVFDAERDGKTPLAELTVTLVDEDGRARWNVPFAQVTVSEWGRASEKGLVAGDATRLYYRTDPAVGNGLILTLLLFGWAVTEIMSRIDGAAGFVERVRTLASSRLNRSGPVLRENAPRWSDRGADAWSIFQMLRGRPWHLADVTTLLECDEEAAQAVLWAFGFAEDSAGLWREGADEAARMVAPLLEEAQLAYDLGHEDFLERLQGRFGYYLASGRRAPRPHIDSSDFGDELVADAVMAEGSGELEEIDSWDPEAVEDDLLGADAEEPEVPLDQLLLRCACGKPDCHVVAGFGVANGGLKIGFDRPTDHFVVAPAFMSSIAMTCEERIRLARVDEPSAAPDDDRQG